MDNSEKVGWSMLASGLPRWVLAPEGGRQHATCGADATPCRRWPDRVVWLSPGRVGCEALGAGGVHEGAGGRCAVLHCARRGCGCHVLRGEEAYRAAPRASAVGERFADIADDVDVEFYEKQVRGDAACEERWGAAYRAIGVLYFCMLLTENPGIKEAGPGPRSYGDVKAMRFGVHVSLEGRLGKKGVNLHTRLEEQRWAS
ncbi:hypothetical protein BJ912DRAFT_924086 [Pholiota molesta]|nr:hypothetical protein BJ912DRAFT_924086 [Pholiota molesta]